MRYVLEYKVIVPTDNISPNTLVCTPSTTFSLINASNVDCIKISKDVKSCQIVGVSFIAFAFKNKELYCTDICLLI